VALGDGNLSKLNGRSVRLRITCDTKYPHIAEAIKENIRVIFPHNKISIVPNRGNYFNISCYSNEWEYLLGWTSTDGPKSKQKACIPDWIKQNKNYTIACLRGLIQTDGSSYNDRGYVMVGFVSYYPELAYEVYGLIQSLNFTPRIYRIPLKNNSVRFNIRLSQNVSDFLRVTKAIKS